MNEFVVPEPCDPYQLIDALLRSGRLAEQRLDAALAVVGLSAAKWAVLRHLVEAGGQLPLGQLAARLACVKSNATQLVDKLEAEQKVRRVPAADDRRSVHAEVTAEGRLSYATGLEVIREFERRLLGEFAPDERRLLEQLLRRLGSAETVAG